MKWFTLFVWVLWVIINYSSGLRDVWLEAPEASERGARVEMRCHYELENEVLYTVKWYRGEREFCRYSPRDVPPLKIFKIPGILVVTSETDAHRLTIAQATAVGQGRYTCEVSAEAPSFQTSVAHTFMHVVDLPDEGPELYGMQDGYKAGMKLRAECVLRDTQPAANLTFLLNREPVVSKQVWHRVEVGANKLMTAYSNIQFVVQRHDFKDNRIKVLCLATIYSIYVKGVEVGVEELDPPTTTITSTTTAKPRRRRPRPKNMQRNSNPTTTSTAPKHVRPTTRLIFSIVSLTELMIAIFSFC